jgi:hypothetical protein
MDRLLGGHPGQHEPEHARAFIAALTAPEMRSRWTAAGWEPAK